jgi:hypothetical protein
VWSKFRALPGVRAYYEPWHEQLERLNAQTLDAETPDNSGLRHPGGSRPYLGEFEPVLDPAGGVRGYHDRFALDRYFLEPDEEDPDQQTYIAGLIAAARARDEVPVLACCRTLGRIDWLKRRFDGFHIVLIRDPVQQWMSFYSLRKRPRPTYFELCQYVILSELPGRAAQAQALLGARFTARGRLAQRIAAVRRRLKRARAQVSFAAFMAVYLLSYLRALPQADLVIDVDRMARDPDYARAIEAAIRQASGLAPDFSDCRTPERHDLAPVPFRAMARAVVSDLDLRGAIASRESLLLYGKLANTFALMPSQAPSAADRWVMVVRGWVAGLAGGGTALARR